MPAVVRGNPITLDCLSDDNNGNPVNPTGLSVSIIDAFGTTVVSLDTNVTIVALGHAQYEYTPPANAFPGAWTARWFGTIDGNEETDDDGFTVLGSATPSDGTTCTPWATHEDAPPALQVYPIDPLDVDDAYQIASDILYQLTGRRWPGVCTDVIRPQAQWRSYDGPRWWPSWQGSTWWGWCSCHRGRETGCSRLSEIKLPGHPVQLGSLTVKVDGDELVDGENYRLDDHRFLVRIDGEGWPCCQDLKLDDTEDRTFSIEYNYGTGPPIGGTRAAVLLGTWWYSQLHPEASCAPPKRATRVTRAGTTVELGDPSTMAEDGLTGIPAVDQWVASVLLGRGRRRATALIPGRHRSARRVDQ